MIPNIEPHKDKIYLGGELGWILESSDGGVNFNTAISLATANNIRVLASEGERIFAFSANNNSDNYYSDNEFTSVQSVSIPASGNTSVKEAIVLDGRMLHIAFSGVWGQRTDDLVNYNSVNYYLKGSEFGNGLLFGRRFAGEVARSSDRGSNYTIGGDLVPDGSIPNTGSALIFGSDSREPNVFSVADMTDVSIGATITSAPVTISGMTEYQNVYASDGAEVNVDSSGWVAGWGAASVTNGSIMEIRMTSSASPDTETTTTIRIANRRDDWTVKTINQVDLFIADAATVNEGETLEFVVSLSQVSAGDVTFTWDTYEGSAVELEPTDTIGDYVPVSGALATIPSGQGKITLEVLTYADDWLEWNQNLEVSLSGLSANASFVDELAVGTITDGTVPFSNVPELGCIISRWRPQHLESF